MKQFDVVLTNPPYSGGKKGRQILYGKFIALALNLIKDDGKVCAVTPLSTVDGIQQKHSKLVHDHMIGEASDVSQHFTVGASIKSYVLGKTVLRDWQPKIDLLWPDRVRLVDKVRLVAKAFNGKPITDAEKEAFKGAIKFPYTIHAGDVVEYRYMDAQHYGKYAKRVPKSPWLLLIHDKLVVHADGTVKPLNSTIVQSDPQNPTLHGWCFAIGCESEAQAKRIKEHLASPQVLAFLKGRLDARGALHTIVKSDMMLLPWYE